MGDAPQLRKSTATNNSCRIILVRVTHPICFRNANNKQTRFPRSLDTDLRCGTGLPVTSAEGAVLATLSASREL